MTCKLIVLLILLFLSAILSDVWLFNRNKKKKEKKKEKQKKGEKQYISKQAE